MNQQLNKLKEFWGKLSDKLKKGIVLSASLLLIFAIGMAFLLNNKSTKYVALYSGLGDQEASEVMGKLREIGVAYQFDQDGRILVLPEVADQVRATLAVEGYPKSGFAYETFLGNAGMMSTESDKEFLKVGDMQNRLAATIGLLDGVKTAVVQLSMGESKKYVLDNSESQKPSASITVLMKNGGSPAPEQVEGIQRLVAKSVANMEMGDVAVIDGNGIDVSVVRSDVENKTSVAKMTFEQNVEATVEQNILKQLESLYGRNNVKVSVRATADLQTSISEESTFTAPNIEENAGYITRQSLASDGVLEGDANEQGGVPGADSNANVPQYNTPAGNMPGALSASSDTEFALNEKRVQSQSDTPIISDLTVAVSINSENLNIERDELITLIAKAAGIDATIQNEKIAVVNSVWAGSIAADNDQDVEVGAEGIGSSSSMLYVIIVVGIILLVGLLVFFFLRKKNRDKELKELDESLMSSASLMEEANTEESNVPKVMMIEEDERGKEVKENIRNFAQQNPEISAQLLKNWLREGDSRE